MDTDLEHRIPWVPPEHTRVRKQHEPPAAADANSLVGIYLNHLRPEAQMGRLHYVVHQRDTSQPCCFLYEQLVAGPRGLTPMSTPCGGVKVVGRSLGLWIFGSQDRCPTTTCMCTVLLCCLCQGFLEELAVKLEHGDAHSRRTARLMAESAEDGRPADFSAVVKHDDVHFGVSAESMDERIRVSDFGKQAPATGPKEAFDMTLQEQKGASSRKGIHTNKKQ